MNKSIRRRLIFAAAVSFTGFAASYAWYTSGLKNEAENNAEPVARIVESKNEVQRKPVTRVIWQNVNKDSLLYGGEAIRTSEDSDARIEFIKSGTVVDLEPESLVVIQENAGKLALDFMKGNVQVKGSGSDSELTLKSGNKEILVGTGDVSFAKQKNGGVNFEVLSGQATIKSGDQTLTLENGKNTTLGDQLNVQKNQIVVTYPKADQVLYMDSKTSLATIRWDSLPNDYDVALEAGAQRNKLQKLANTDSEKKSVDFKSKVGPLYWRLVARPKKAGLPELTSTTYKTNVLAKTPVQLISPLPKEIVSAQEDGSNTFRWNNPAHLEKLQVEVFSLENGKQKLVENKQAAGNELKLAIDKIGNYQWRITGYLKGTTEAVSSEMQSFQWQKFAGLSAPQLKFPNAQAKLMPAEVEKEGVFFSWEPSKSAVKYSLKIAYKDTNKNARNTNSDKEIEEEHSSNSPLFRLKQPKAGTYTWYVVAENEKGETKNSEKRTFQVQELPSLQWAEQNQTYEYVSEDPSLKLNWQKPVFAFHQYQYKILSESDNEGTWQKTETPYALQKLKQDGVYQVQLEALNEKNEVIAKAETRKIEIRKKPLLPAPQFDSAIGEIIEAQKNGSAKLDWQDLQGAKQYVVQVKTHDGKLKEFNFKNNQAQLKNLLPGSYKVALRAIDEFGRKGTLGDEKVIHVPDTSDIAAPRVKTLKVK